MVWRLGVRRNRERQPHQSPTSHAEVKATRAFSASVTGPSVLDASSARHSVGIGLRLPQTIDARRYWSADPSEGIMPTTNASDPSLDTSEFVGSAVLLTPADWRDAAEALDVEEAALRAVADVESAGSGFLADRRPAILFEAHLFSKLTGHIYDKDHPDISSPIWNKALYSKKSADEYVRLAKAIKLDRTAALKAASWGRFQILGTNHMDVGFQKVDSFVREQCRSERAQLDAFVKFVKFHKPIWSALKKHDWAAFARRYNGPGYAKNHYDTKLAERYRKRSKHTKKPPAGHRAPRPPVPEVRMLG
jgi:hypothetical protein